MTPAAGLRSLRSWLSTRGDAYAWVITALALNIPILVLALGRHLEGVAWMSRAGLYALLVFVGYYSLILLILVSGLFVVTLFSRRLFLGASAVLLTSAVFYLTVNGAVHRVYRLHIDAYWLQYTFTSFSGFGVSRQVLTMVFSVLALAVLVEWGVFRLARRARHRKIVVIGLVAVTMLAFGASQAVHVVAYEKNDTRVTGITPQLPFYYPIVSHHDAVRYGDMLPMISEPGESSGSSPSFRYPLHDVPCVIPAGHRRPNILMIVLESWRFDAMDEVVSPNIHAFSQQSSVFLNHFSSGNSTPSGIFSLFYGIHPTYWTAVKANSATIDNPVLIDALRANGYEFGIFANSHFQRHKIKDAMFRGIEVHETFAGRTPDAKDRDMTKQVLAFIAQQDSARTPFFAFAFYKSTHFSYYYPKDAVRFRPTHKLNPALASTVRDPSLFLNDYRNAVSYVDSLVGDLMRQLEASGVLGKTIVVITSDHGEEFNDNKANYWGHCGNFTGYQTKVPMIVYVPWKRPRRVNELTAHVDVPQTLLQEGLGCGRNAADYSNGRNMFGSLAGERPLIISSYVNHAVITGDDVYVVYPVYVQKYKLWDINAKAGPPRAGLARQAMEEMHRFYGGGGTDQASMP